MSKKLLIMLVAIVTGVFMASGAMAINYGDIGYGTVIAPKTAGTILNPEGKGDVLIAPYYDVRVLGGKAQDTYFAIINENTDDTDDAGVAAKLRFREWDKSEEVFDIDIWLSENDVWVGVLTRNAANGLTRITSPDYVIIDDTTETFTISKTTAVSTGMDFFTTYAPGGSSNTKAPPSGFTSTDLTNMGYFEIIGEERTYSKPSTTTAPIKVTRLDADWDCPNSLSAYVYIVRVDDGVSLGYNATAIANFRRDDYELYVGPGATLPGLHQCADGLDQLEFEISKAKVYHGYSVEDIIAGKFSLIVTFPTKHYHFGARPIYTFGGVTYGPPFTGTHANYGEVVDVNIFDRNETPYSPEEGFWSPRITPTISLPWEVNIIGLYSATPPTVPVLGNRNNVAFTTGGFQTGWVWIDLYNSVHAALPYTDPFFGHLGLPFTGGYNGMPALSLALQEFSNGLVGGYYGVIFPAYYVVDWTL